MTVDASGFSAPQFGLPAGINRHERFALAKEVALVKAFALAVQPPKLEARLVAESPKKTECWCGRCAVCVADAKRYREKLLRKS
jgi:hypothetical protein